MAQLLNRVQPGDLITANMWNLAVDAINQLLVARPAAGVTVAATSPRGITEDPIRTGAILQIVGQNFGYSTGLTKVSFEGSFGRVEVSRNDLLPGSTDTRLLLTVPPIPTMTNAGMTMTLRVDSGISQDARSVFVQPIVINLTGDMFVTWRGDVTPNPKPNPLQVSTTGAPQAAEVALKLESGTNLPATFTLSADIKNASVAIPSGLVASIVFVNDSGAVISNKTVEMGTNDTRNILVRIPEIPSSFAAQSFELHVDAVAGGVTGTFSRSFTVGVAVQPPDPNIQPQLTGSVVFDVNDNPDTNPANGERSGTTIKLKKDFQMVVMYNLKLAGTAATYDLTIQPKQAGTLTGWSAQLANTPASIPGPDTGRLVQFAVKPTGTPVQSGTLVFRIRKQGATTDWFQEFAVELLP